MDNNATPNIISFNDYINCYIEKYNEKHKEQILDYQSASICTKQGAYSILEFQPKCDLIINSQEGILFGSNGYNDKVDAFINHSFEKEYDLILSPEYSIPVSAIKQLLKSEIRINSGSLYCLCCQGIPKKDFSNFLFELKDKFEICYDCYNYLNNGEIICVLLYIIRVKFICEHGCLYKTFIIPQPKTNPMKDPKMDFERSVLSTGQKIVSFGNNKETRLLGIICSDIFNFTLMSEIKQYIAENRVLLIHPQLNSKPQNDYFRFMRTMLINYSGNNSIKVITVNWSNKTTFSFDNITKTEPIKYSWSAVFEKYNENELAEYFNLFEKNARKGVNIAHNHHTVSYFFPSEEFLIDYQIRALSSTNNPEDIQKTVPLKVLYYYNYSNDTFEVKDYRCELMIDDYFIDKEEFSSLNDCKTCKETKCYKCRINEINKYMASLFQRSVDKEFEIINDGNITSVTAKHYRSKYSKEKLYICKKILNQMKKGNVTNKFQNGTSFQYFYIESEGLVFNTKYTIEGFSDIFVRIVFLQNSQKCEAENVYNLLCNQYGDNAENIMVFYESEDGIFVYPQNLNTTITSEIVNNNASIIGGLL